MDAVDKHPKLLGLQQLWESKRRDGHLPSRADFDVFELQPWLGHLNVVEIIDDGSDFLYRIHGSDLVPILGMDLTGRKVSELPPQSQEIVIAEHRQIISRREPVYFRRIRLNRDTDHHTIVKLGLPLARDGRTIDRLMLCLYVEG